MRYLLIISLLFVISMAFALPPEAQYTIKMEWDEMNGELNAVLSGQIEGEYAYIQGAFQASALGGKITSSGETAIGTGTQTFQIFAKEGFFSFWIRDKFADDDINPDQELIRKAEPKISVFSGNSLLRSFIIDKGVGLTCKVFTLDAESGFIDSELRFYPKTKMILTQVLNAVDGTPVSAAKIEINGGEYYEPLFTDADGFAFFPLEIGDYQLSINKVGFIPSSYPVRMGFDENPQEYVVALSPEVREYRIVLTWGSRPMDLDAHLSGPNPDGGNFHIWYRNRILIAGRDFLDRDDTNAYGPETITIYKPAPGEYLYAVHDYSNKKSSASKQLSRSSATVQVYSENRLLNTFSIPANQAGTLWKVFKIDKNHRVIPINTLSWIKDEKDIR